MLIFEIKKGTSFETLDGTLLKCKSVDDGIAIFNEYEYNIITNEYDILLDDNRILTKEEIKVELYRAFGENYKVRMI